MRYLIPQINVPFFMSVSGLVFLLTFIGIIFYVYSKSKAKVYERAASLALDSNED